MDTSKNIGSLYIKNLLGQFKAEVWFDHYCKNVREDIDLYMKNLHEALTIPGQEISLPDIAYIYSLMDFRELSETRSTKLARDHFSRINLEKTFLNCFNYLANSGVHEKKNSYYDQFLQSQKKPNYLPCEEIEKYPLCVVYCKWHKSFFSGWSKEKFLTVMRYALPQRKIILEPKLPDEKQLAEELFGSEKVKNLSTLVSPKSLPILCHRKDEDFT